MNSVGANYKHHNIFLDPRGASKYTGPKLSIHDFTYSHPWPARSQCAPRDPESNKSYIATYYNLNNSGLEHVSGGTCKARILAAAPPTTVSVAIYSFLLLIMRRFLSRFISSPK
jgi:hypothetical protein